MTMGCGESKEKTSNKVSPKKHDKEVNNNYSSNKLNDIDDDLASFYLRKRPEEQPQLKEVEFRNIMNLEGHTNYVDVCCVNPKFDALITAASDRKAILWSLGRDDAKRKQVLRIPESESVSCADWSPDGTLFALGTEQGQVMVWSSKGELRASWYPCEYQVRSVKINGDLVGSAGSLVCVYSLTGSVCQIFEWNKTLATCFEWMNESKFLVGESSGMITLDVVNPQKMKKIEDFNDENIENQEPKKKFNSHLDGVYKVAKNPHRSSIFASCSVDFSIKIWSMDDKKPKQNMTGHFGYVVDICWLDTDTLVSASYDGSVKLWNTSNGECHNSLEAHHDHVCSVKVSPDGKYIASGGHDGVVNVWPAYGSQLINSFEGSGRILSCDFNHSGTKLIAASYGNVIVSEIEINEVPKQYIDKKIVKKVKQHSKSKKK